MAPTTQQVSESDSTWRGKCIMLANPTVKDIFRRSEGMFLIHVSSQHGAIHLYTRNKPLRSTLRDHLQIRVIMQITTGKLMGSTVDEQYPSLSGGTWVASPLIYRILSETRDCNHMLILSTDARWYELKFITIVSHTDVIVDHLRWIAGVVCVYN